MGTLCIPWSITGGMATHQLRGPGNIVCIVFTRYQSNGCLQQKFTLIVEGARITVGVDSGVMEHSAPQDSLYFTSRCPY